jgi:hypothetical protein
MDKAVDHKAVAFTVESRVVTFFKRSLGEWGKQWLLEMESSALPVEATALFGQGEGKPLREHDWFITLVARVAGSPSASSPAFPTRVAALRRERDQALGVVNSFEVHYRAWRREAEERVYAFDTLGEISRTAPDEAERDRRLLQLTLAKQWEGFFTPEHVHELDLHFKRLMEATLALETHEVVLELASGEAVRKRGEPAINQDWLYIYSLMSAANDKLVRNQKKSLTGVLQWIADRFGSSGEGWPLFSYGKLFQVIDNEFIKRNCGFVPKKSEHLGKALGRWFDDRVKELPPKPKPL